MPPRVTRENRLRIVELSKQGKSLRAIAAEIGCTVATVLRVVHAYRDEGRIGDAARSSRSRVTDDFQDLMIIAAVVDEPFLSAGDIKRALGIPASEQTIRHRLHEAGLSCINSNTRRSLEPACRNARFNFASEYSSWTANQWQSVVFTNESTICCKWDTSKQSWRPLQNWNDPLFVRQLGACSRPFINVWTVVTYEGLGPIYRVEKGSLTPDGYVDVVDNLLMPFLLNGPFPDGGFLLQHDPTPTYSSCRVREYLAVRGIAQMPWPPKFEDLNPIRNAWSLVKERLQRRRLADPSPDKLWALIKKEWDKLRDIPNVVCVFYASLPEKMREVVASKGAFVVAAKEPLANGQSQKPRKRCESGEKRLLPKGVEEDECVDSDQDSTVIDCDTPVSEAESFVN